MVYEIENLMQFVCFLDKILDNELGLCPLPIDITLLINHYVLLIEFKPGSDSFHSLFVSPVQTLESLGSGVFVHVLVLLNFTMFRLVCIPWNVCYVLLCSDCKFLLILYLGLMRSCEKGNTYVLLKISLYLEFIVLIKRAWAHVPCRFSNTQKFLHF